ncbi:hypothetical protein NAL19_1962 [Pectobacterium sp. F1-1]|nr:hypothetical protein NAL19_1962 [Pectobacterium sp. F1-1]
MSPQQRQIVTKYVIATFYAVMHGISMRYGDIANGRLL